VNRIAELTLTNRTLYRNLDMSVDRVHAGFAWAIPAMYKLLASSGEKAPRISRKDL
jgi:hypothetical protein